MLFSFLKYISPTWYFNLTPKGQKVPYFVDFRKLDKSAKSLLDVDDGYRTFKGKLADAAYQAWQKGIMIKDPGNDLYLLSNRRKPGKTKIIELFDGKSVTVIDEAFVTDVSDNYRFIKRFFNPGIAWYIFFIRLISLYNPFKEISGFFKSIKVKRINPYSRNTWLLFKDTYSAFNSVLLRQQPKVSVIIPTLNRYEYLKDVLNDLEKQEYRNFEVIVCDQSDNFSEDFYKGWNFDLVLVRQEDKALCKARNNSMAKSSSDYILLFDDDSRVESDWITQHLKCIDYFKADISSGISVSSNNDNIPKKYSYLRWSDQLDTGNVMFRKIILKCAGMLDEQFEGQTNEDAEFGLRFYILGFRAVSNPFAMRIHLKAPKGGMREMSGWDSLRPKNIFAPRPVPSVLYFSRKYFGNHVSRLMLLFSMPWSLIPYQYKSSKWAKILAVPALLILWPLLIVQIARSWSLATAKLQAGSLIERL